MAEQATLARPYARASFEHAREHGRLAAWGDVLARAGLTVADPRVAALIGNPHVGGDELISMIGDIAGASADQKASNFLRLVADNGRLELLPEIASQFAALRAEVENTVDVTVTSAMPLTAEQTARLTETMTGRLQKTVRVHEVVDPTLLGGAVVQAGDFVVDGSLRGRVERLAGSLSAR